MNYWIAYTEAKNHRYACLFTDFYDAGKYINVLTSTQNNLIISGLRSDFEEELKQNFAVKYFDNKAEAISFRDDFLNSGN